MNEQLCIVLKANDYRDNDKMVTLFSRKIGRVSCLARGVKSPKSHNASAVQPLCCGLYQFSEKNGYKYLMHADIKKNYATLASDYDAFVAACSFLSFADRYLDIIADYDDFFVLLVNCINALYLGVPSREVKCFFVVKIFDITGVRPLLDECVLCGKKISVPEFFCFNEGGIICGDCRKYVSAERVSVKAVNAIGLMTATRPVDFMGCRDADDKLLNSLVHYLKIMTDIDFK